jgi:hypothetical protein
MCLILSTSTSANTVACTRAYQPDTPPLGKAAITRRLPPQLDRYGCRHARRCTHRKNGRHRCVGLLRESVFGRLPPMRT